MAAKKPTEPKVILEREYIVPLRKGWLKVPEYKRATKAMKTLKKFIAKHMKLYDTDLRKIKINQLLNNEIRFRGMKKPPAKIKVKAIKLDNDTIKVELVNLPTHVKFAQTRELKLKSEIEKKVKEKQETKPPVEETEKESKDKEEKETKEEKKEEAKEKQEASKEESLKIAEQQAKTQKHTSKEKNIKINRKTLSR